MKLFRLFMILGVSLSLIMSCSKKQEEADKLEKEMMEGSIDTLIDTTHIVDTVAIAAPEEVPSGPEVDPMPKQPTGSGFTVQVASCEDETYARYLVDLYTTRGYEPFVSEFSIDGQNYYRVRIGVFENSSEAKLLKQELADKFSLSTWIDFIEF